MNPTADNPTAINFSYSELKELTKEQLINKYNHYIKTTQVGISFILDEIRYREQQEYSDVILDYTKKTIAFTKQVTALTWLIAFLTIIMSVPAIVEIIRFFQY